MENLEGEMIYVHLIILHEICYFSITNSDIEFWQVKTHPYLITF